MNFRLLWYLGLITNIRGRHEKILLFCVCLILWCMLSYNGRINNLVR